MIATGLVIESGASAGLSEEVNDSVVDGGTLSIGYIDHGDTVFNGGFITIAVSGTGIDEHIGNGGTIAVGLGGATAGSVIGSGGQEIVAFQPYEFFPSGGTASDTTVQAGGILDVLSSGTAGSTVIDGGTVILDASQALLINGVTFAGAGELQVNDLAEATYGDQAIITGFQKGDVIDVSAVGTDASLTSTVIDGNTDLTISGSEGRETFIFSGTFTPGYFELIQNNIENPNDAQIVTEQCFLKGTRILTSSGEVAVEDLHTGDQVLNLSGEFKTIIWVGSWQVDLDTTKSRRKVTPVKIMAGALDNSIPHRDLFVSPDHGLFLSDMLIPAYLLINDTTITQPDRRGVVTYYHVQVEPHDILLAEGVATESFLDLGTTPFSKLDEEPRSWEDACAPLVIAGLQLEKIRRQLERKSQILSTV